MKYILLLFFLGVNFCFSQNVDCNSHRFDLEIFSTVDIASDVQYGSNTDANGSPVNLTLDVYSPAGDTMVVRPLIIWAHGGSFISGTKNDVDVVKLSERFAKRGYVCASINYRLGIPFPINQESALKAVYRSVQDMKAAIRFFRKDAATANLYKIDPSIIYIGGSSAGAFAALHAAYLNSYSELPILIDTLAMGTLEGNSGNPGFSTAVNGVIDLCGALGNRSYLQTGDVPFVAMHGNADNTVPYATDVIYMLGAWPIMVVDGSYSIAAYADTLGVYNQFYTYYGAGHVPYVFDNFYMDTTVQFVSNFLYKHLGCSPIDPNPLPNTFTTGIPFVHAEELLFFPNPGDGRFTSVTSDRNIFFEQISVYDMNGRMCLNRKIEEENFKLDLSDYNPGIYYYRLQSKEKVEGGKLIIR